MDKKVIIPPSRTSDKVNLVQSINVTNASRNMIYMLRILWSLFKLWKRNPYLRLGQLIRCAASLNNYNGDLFLISDKDIKLSFDSWKK